MTLRATTYERRFMRNADEALLGGVCAGIADYFGFNLCVTRLLVLIAFLAWTPVTLITYVAIVFLVPARSDRHGYEKRLCCMRRKRSRRETRRERREREATARRMEANAVDRRCRTLDERLARIEKYVTSSRFELDREFRNL